jgi:two-component system NtrC family sensor kinase
MVDPHQIQQVFLNIINNGRQAIEGHQPKGSIRVATDTCGDLVRISFEDNGPGIDEKNLSKVFDPFFTTKEVGKGTGLGLSLCYGIIQEHDGSIAVRSRPGEGATFIIVLPLASATDVDVEKKEHLTPAPVTTTEGLGKKVLVIDDEEAILQMVRETLAEQGYEVDVVRDGESALSRLGQTSYDLALCDWKMPGLNGQQIYERVRASNPALSERMIFFTGDVINDKAERFLRESRRVCLSKPFSLVEFRAAIGKALAS